MASKTPVCKVDPAQLQKYPNLLAMYNQDVHHPVTGELLPKGAYLSVQVNVMRYKDGDGVWREIYMPKGTQEQATKYLEEENWAELAKFDEYSKSVAFCERVSGR